MGGLINNAVNNAAESILMRFLRNAGIENMINNPKAYELTMSFINDGAVIKIKRKEEEES